MPTLFCTQRSFGLHTGVLSRSPHHLSSRCSLSRWTSLPVEETQATIMARTNMLHPDDPRPLPRGIGRIPPRPARARPARTRPAPPPRPPTITPMSPRRAALAENADGLILTQLTHIRDNMTDYDARYPAAVEVRTKLGAIPWEKLERYRTRIANFAALMRKIEREEIQVDRALLDRRYYPTMKAYLKKAVGKYMQGIFKCHHDTMDQMLSYDAMFDVNIQEGSSVVTVRELFHRRPFLWFVYNLYFPVRGSRGDPGRMTWVQLKDWAIWTLQNPMEEPSWFSWSRFELVPVKPVSARDLIWNAALIEVFTDVGARFA